MGEKPTYEDLEQRVSELEKEAIKRKQANHLLWERMKKVGANCNV